MSKYTIQATPIKLLDIWGLMSSGFSYTANEIANLVGYKPRQGIYYGDALAALEIASKNEKVRPYTYTINSWYTGMTAAQRSTELAKIIKDKKLMDSIKTYTTKSLAKSKTTQVRRLKDLDKFLSFKSYAYSATNEYQKISDEIWNMESKYTAYKTSRQDNKHTIETIKDKSLTHNKMMNTIIEYAKAKQIPLRPEYMNADLVSYNKKTNEVVILELKSYDGLYMAIGQLLHYEHKFKNTIYKHKNYQYKKIYVTNQKIDQKKLSLLKKLEIEYFNIEHQNIKHLFALWQ